MFGFQPGCARRAADAGQPCAGRSECTGGCVTDPSVPAGSAVVGRCYEYEHVPDTQVNYVEEGRAQGTVIVN